MYKDEFVKKAKAQLDTWSAEMDKIEAAMTKAGETGAAQMKAQFATLEEQRKALEGKLQAIGSANEAAWKEMQGSVEKAWGELTKGFEEARKRYQK